eukprot:scaffold234057_cov39-Prasinocladus_malaysianus.AAC.3
MSDEFAFCCQRAVSSSGAVLIPARVCGTGKPLSPPSRCLAGVADCLIRVVQYTYSSKRVKHSGRPSRRVNNLSKTALVHTIIVPVRE